MKHYFRFYHTFINACHRRGHTCIITVSLSLCVQTTSSIFSEQDVTCEWQLGVLHLFCPAMETQGDRALIGGAVAFFYMDLSSVNTRDSW